MTYFSSFGQNSSYTLQTEDGEMGEVGRWGRWRERCDRIGASVFDISIIAFWTQRLRPDVRING
ncbi:MAG: hypothetical protein VKK42_29930 [Lyngbya sp.]|nr:hypothetical protein [Lyngbya sp.]